jgi:hypothetical protein
MPVPSLKVNGPSAASWMQGSVYVDAFQVQQAIEAVYAAVSPPGLASFLEEYVDPYLDDQIVDRFADQGGGVIGGSWAPLEQSTVLIRHALGYNNDDAVNERTGELLNFLLTNDLQTEGFGASLQKPESTRDTILERKLRTAQTGYTQGEGDMIPGANTPPRPVLGLDATDLVSILKLLQIHVAMYASNLLHSIGTFP